MYSQSEQNFGHTIDLVLNTLRLARDPRWLIGSVPVVGDAAQDPEKLIQRVREAAEAHGFGCVGLDLLGDDRIAFNGSKD
ncbi:EAL domain-containing protein [Pseudomonas sp. IT-P44]